MFFPIKHENMATRRWPVVTLCLIAVNTVVFFLTNSTIENESPELGEVKEHILVLAATHPELKLPPEAQKLVEGVKQSRPQAWQHMQDPYRADLIDAYDASLKMRVDDTGLQQDMDTFTAQYVQLASKSFLQQYAFVPVSPNPISYLTANFLHGGWVHLLGNMWFLWLAGFVLEDAWGYWLYTAFYLIAGAAAIQFYAWTNPGGINACYGASGAVSALMGACLVRFPKMKIEVAWLLFLRFGSFKARAYWLLPLWLLSEILYGTLYGNVGGVAHWAHVGGFLFGAVAAVAIQYSGMEKKANRAIDEKLGRNDPEIEQASGMMEHGKLSEALPLLTNYVAAKPNSLDAWNMLRQIYTRQNNTPAYLDATLKTCALHLRAHAIEAAFQDYAEFIDSGGGHVPAALWLELCKGAEEKQEFERAWSEYEQLAAAYPTERQALTAQLSAARLCLKRLNRPQDALALYQKAAASPIPHLDWEQNIQSGIKEAKAAILGASAASAGA
jgi:membrane associated rhomboid family serine protease